MSFYSLTTQRALNITLNSLLKCQGGVFHAWPWSQIPNSMGHCGREVSTWHPQRSLRITQNRPLLTNAPNPTVSTGSRQRLITNPDSSSTGFPGRISSKEPTSHCRRLKRRGFDPWVRRIHFRRARQPTPVLLPGESHGHRSLVGYSPQGCKELDMTEHACNGESNASFMLWLMHVISLHINVRGVKSKLFRTI